MKHALWLLLACACAHAPPPAPAPSFAPRELQPGDACGPPPAVDAAADAGSLLGAIIEKVCLPGLSPALEQHFLDRLRSKAGEKLDADTLSIDLSIIVHEVTAKDVVALAVPFPGEVKRARLFLLVETYPPVDELTVDGASADDTATILHGFERGLPSSEVYGVNYERAARDSYLASGFADVKVGHRFEPLPSGSARLRLLIEPGVKRVIHSVRIDGVKNAPLGELMTLVHVLSGGPYSSTAADSYRPALLSIGYNHGLIEARAAQHFDPQPTAEEPGAGDLVFDLEEGPVYHVGTVQVTGTAFPKAAKVLAALRSKPKAVYSRAALEEDELKLRALAKHAGFEAATDRRVEFHVENKTADVVFSAQRTQAR